MTNKFYVLLLFFISFSTVSIAQLLTPAMSPSAEIKQKVGLTNIEINYSRPSARGRKIFGTEGLLPISEFWRIGANAATKITFSDDVMIGDKTLEKGSYTILSKPNTGAWSIHFYPYESRSWTTYVKKEPVIIINAINQKLNDFVETFTIDINDITMSSASLTLTWEQTKIIIPIKVETHDRVMANIKKTMDGPSNNDYYQAALYMQETETDLNKALAYIQKVTKGDSPLFFQVYREALILANLNRSAEAITAAKKSMELSKKSGNEDFVRLNKKLIKKLSE